MKNGRDSNSKSRGVKVLGGQPCKSGGIIIRQLGNKVSEISHVCLICVSCARTGLAGIVGVQTAAQRTASYMCRGLSGHADLLTTAHALRCVSISWYIVLSLQAGQAVRQASPA